MDLQFLIGTFERYVYFNSFSINYYCVILREKELIVLHVSEESISIWLSTGKSQVLKYFDL